MKLACAAVLFAFATACTASDADDEPVVGPFTGAIHRYTLDRVVMPTDPDTAYRQGDDLDGDDNVDNALGVAVSDLAQEGDSSTAGDDMIAAGVIASSIAIQTDDLVHGARVGVTFYGSDGDPATVMGGALHGGTLQSNLTRDGEDLGAARVHVPIFENVEPIALDLTNAEIELVADANGSGFAVTIRGIIPTAELGSAVTNGMLAMLHADPQAHAELAAIIDANHDGVITPAEIGSSFAGEFETPDLPTGLSAAVAFHATPCAVGQCNPAPPADACRDGVRDGDETDVDCGGSCPTCAGGDACGSDGDCQTQACSGGTCAEPSCHDGIRDGFETGVDCGVECGADAVCAGSGSAR